MKASLLTAGIVMGLLVLPAMGSVVPNDPWAYDPVTAPTDEYNLYELYNMIYGTGYTSNLELDVMRVVDVETWLLDISQLPVGVTAEARYAWLEHDFGWYDATTGVETEIFGDMNMSSGFLTGMTATINPGAGNEFGFYLGVTDPVNQVENTWYSESDLNWNWAQDPTSGEWYQNWGDDHLVVYSTADANTFLLAWEDMVLGHPQGHDDYNDLLIEIRIPENIIPEPTSMVLLGLGIAGMLVRKLRTLS